ncbi:transposase [Streptomyces sp. NPDC020681]|uniref:transposase n=1 Tax=Streptomyces sp. NPDC020681 TaxID=3365083 RepID=UPI0037A12474
MSPAVEDRPAGDHGGWDRSAFVEEMGLAWELAGAGRMDGRIIGYLMIMNVPHVSSAELAKALRVSAGSISLATRRLSETGFIRRYAVPGERGHFFGVDEDVWGGFLAGERRYLRRQEDLAARGLELLGPDDEVPRRRLEIMREYMRWLIASHRKTLQEWNEYRQHGGDGSAAPGETVEQTLSEVPVSRGGDEESGGTATLDAVLAERLLPDILWEAAEPLLPTSSSRPQGGGTRTRDERTALTAVVYVLTSGCGWQQLPPQFGISPATAHRRFVAWGRADLWERWRKAVELGSGAGHPDTQWCDRVADAAAGRQSGS